MYTLDDLLLDEPYLEIEGNKNILKSFLILGESNIDNEIERIKANMPMPIAHNINDGDKKIIDFISSFLINIGERTKYEIHIRQRLRQSIVLQLYSFLEFYLTKQCSIHKDRNRLNTGWEKMNEKGELAKIKAYYSKHIQIDISSNIDRWNFILTFKTLRNTIMHSQGKFTDSKIHKRLIQLSNSETYSIIKESTSNFYRVEMTENFIDYCIDEISEFLK
jgi:hypothetical protein